MADLTDEIGGGTEVKTLFFGEGVEASKKNADEGYALTTAR